MCLWPRPGDLPTMSKFLSTESKAIASESDMNRKMFGSIIYSPWIISCSSQCLLPEYKPFAWVGVWWCHTSCSKTTHINHLTTYYSLVFFFFFFFLLFFVVTGGVWSSFPPALTSGLKPSSSQRLEALAASTGFPGGSVVKNLPEVQETWVRSLEQKDLLM